MRARVNICANIQTDCHTLSLFPTTLPVPSASEDHERARLVGFYECDITSSGYNLTWESFEEMGKWIVRDEEESNIKFIKKDKITPSAEMSKQWTSKQVYACARGQNGGKNKYTKKQNWERAVPIKKSESGCSCRLTIKTYPYTNCVAGSYNNSHSHEIGSLNTRFTRLRKETRIEIEHLLRLGIDPQKVVLICFIYMKIGH